MTKLLFMYVALGSLLIPVVFSATISIPEQCRKGDANSKKRKKTLPFFQRCDGQLFHFDLAKAYGKLSQPAFNEMDKNMKIIIGHTVSEILNLRELKWDEITEKMNQNTLIKRNVFSEVHRQKKKTFGSKSVHLENVRDVTLINSVASWFVNFVGDSQVLDDTNIDFGAVTEMLGKSNVGFHNVKTLLWNKHMDRKRFVDSGILRIPDITYPHFVLYRIKLTASIKIKRALVIVSKRTNVNAIYHRLVYDLQPEKVANLSEISKGTALDEVEDTFSHLIGA